MILYHATLKSNLSSIRKHGLNPDFSTGKEKVIWYHTKSRTHWAIAHVQKRQKVNLSEVVIISVKIPRSKLTRRWRGLWTTDTAVTAFVSITDAEVFAASPITDN